MAYNGYLLKVNGTAFPMKYIVETSYVVSPDQRLDLESQRDATGVLHRNVCEHMPVKIEFKTTPLTDSDVSEISRILLLDKSNRERTATVEYYNTETGGYATAKCYVPNLEYTIDWIDNEKNTVHYNSTRYAFIEY